MRRPSYTLALCAASLALAACRSMGDEPGRATADEALVDGATPEPVEAAMDGFDRDGFDRDGFDRDGFDRDGFDRDGADRDGADAAPPAIPMDVDGSYDKTIDYLLDRYDADGDGAVGAAEYGRSKETFDRLDRNDDGLIRVDDYAQPEDDSREERLRAFRGSMILARFFQADDDASQVSAEEVLAAADEYDADGDGRVDEAEFTCAFEARTVPWPAGSTARLMKRRMGDGTPWESALAVDADGDGALSTEELGAHFAENSVAETWGRMSRPRESRERMERTGRDRGEDRSGAAEGAVAPDFTLASPDGSETVTLSDYAGAKPVALVFGSYT